MADNFNNIHMTEPVAQLSGNLPKVFQEQMVKLSLISAEVPIPGKDVISITVVKHYQE
jgi:hypothetical protein